MSCSILIKHMTCITIPIGLQVVNNFISLFAKILFKVKLNANVAHSSKQYFFCWPHNVLLPLEIGIVGSRVFAQVNKVFG